MISLHESGSTLISVRSGWQDAHKMLQIKEEARKREAERFHIFLQMSWCLCLKNVWNSLAITTSCQGKTVKFDERRESRDENHAQVVLFTEYGLECDWWFFFLCPGKTILHPFRVRASLRNPDPYGGQAGTWRLDNAEVMGLWVKGQERRPDVE